MACNIVKEVRVLNGENVAIADCALTRTGIQLRASERLSEGVGIVFLSERVKRIRDAQRVGQIARVFESDSQSKRIAGYH